MVTIYRQDLTHLSSQWFLIKKYSQPTASMFTDLYLNWFPEVLNKCCQTTIQKFRVDGKNTSRNSLASHVEGLFSLLSTQTFGDLHSACPRAANFHINSEEDVEVCISFVPSPTAQNWMSLTIKDSEQQITRYLRFLSSPQATSARYRK